MFLKQKRYRKIKGGAVAYGQKERTVPKKSDVTSPTAATKLVIMTAAIDATEIQDVAVIDTPGVFMTADMGEEVIVIL